MRKALALLLVFVWGCNPTTYPTDVFPEMHYAPSQRRGEPRRFSPPPDAVPITGARPSYTYAEAAWLSNPVPVDAGTLRRAGELYRVNCAMCHGRDGHAQSVTADAFRAAGAVPPVDFAAPRVRDRTDGQLYWIIANGLGGMPAFGDLLSDADLWTVVLFVRQAQDAR
jgi:mono/diheme cytochrome c family protein